ncbi:MAG: imidazolonepropionase [Thermoprotei archaeon]
MNSKIIVGKIVTPEGPCVLNGRPRLRVIQDGAVAFSKGKILAVGERDSVRTRYSSLELVDRRDYLVTPGLIDPHTHILYHGNRSDELDLKLQGLSYRDIAQMGGGIMRTVRETRDHMADVEREALERITRMTKCGTTTVEVKSGYGLSVDSELALMRTAHSLSRKAGVRILRTLLSAHAVPPEYSGREAAYVKEVVFPTIDLCSRSNLAEFVDVFCEEGYFDPSLTLQVCDYAKSKKMRVKIHADEFSDIGGARIAGQVGAVSADHLGCSNAENLRFMAEKGVVGVLLPLLFHSNMLPIPDARKFRGINLIVALGTDFNPNNPVDSQLVTLNHGCLRLRMTPPEAFCSVTANAAAALRLESEIGILAEGYSADIAVYDADSISDLAMRCGSSPLLESYVAGEPLVT